MTRTGRRYTLAVVTCLMLLDACKAETSPLSELRVSDVRAIDVADHDGRRVQITDPEGIQFFVGGAKGLRAKKDFKVNPEFEIVVQKRDGGSIRLRMGRDHIGPDVPASAGVTRWYFDGPDMYQFIARRLRERP